MRGIRFKVELDSFCFQRACAQVAIDTRQKIFLALARLGLARAYSLQGDAPKARATYQDFLALWKDADPNIPILRESKAEYAKLR